MKKLLQKDNKPIAKLSALKPKVQKREPGSAKGLVKISADFDDPLDNFTDSQI